MSEAKRPRLDKMPKLNSETWQCFIRHFSGCYQKDPKSTRVRKKNLVKATLVNNRSVCAAQSLFRGLCLQNKIGGEFEFQLNHGNGARFRLPDDISFALLNLVKPLNIQISGTFGDFKNYKRIDQLIALSKNANELVAHKPIHEDNFILLLQSMGTRPMNLLECDPKFLVSSEIPILRLNTYKSTPTRIQVPLRDILWHKIKCLDLRNDANGACIADDECPTQKALEKLIVSGTLQSPNDALVYFQDVKVFAPNLKSYEIEFNEELPADQLDACKFSSSIWSKFKALTSLVDKCKDQMDFLTIRAKVSAELPSNKTKYETTWRDELQRLSSTDCQFKEYVNADTNGRVENVEIQKRDGFLNLEFKVHLSILPEWNDNLLFGRLSS
ncbi:hypothetical protein M3Y97_00534300 [Aphelenchoides bicaudatus]|nr:hypothetical protein M3Y97_00534300 [Aphelenchoides bicaudatus]